MHDGASITLLAAYFLVIEVICLYGLHRYWLVWLFVRHRSALRRTPADAFDDLPTVTVQLPMFNERHVAERVIAAACELDYPGDRLQVQVLDDSTDESAEVVRQCCQHMAERGCDIQYLHRSNREGYKAGALAAGAEVASGEFLAVFDADFVPPRDCLRKVIEHFTDDSIGMVQMRWSHLNRDRSLLTKIQAMFLDGHFIVEQTARAATGRWFNFNGTAGIWRRSCIEQAGGWQHDTLTEDADLSYRAYLAGWRSVYLPDVTCPAELPPTMNAFISQQHRWTKGLIQTGLKLLPRILRSDASWRIKLEAFFHLTCPIVHLFILLLVLLAGPALAVTVSTAGFSDGTWLWLGVSFLALGTIAASTFYLVSQWAQGRSLWKTTLLLPALMAVGIGVCLVNSRAILEALRGVESPFVRTPKFNRSLSSDLDPVIIRAKRLIGPGVVEVGLGGLMIICVGIPLAVSAVTGDWPGGLVGLPFMLLFASGFFLVGFACRKEISQPGPGNISAQSRADSRSRG